jgi:hypothetical protein
VSAGPGAEWVLGQPEGKEGWGCCGPCCSSGKPQEGSEQESIAIYLHF